MRAFLFCLPILVQIYCTNLHIFLLGAMQTVLTQGGSSTKLGKGPNKKQEGDGGEATERTVSGGLLRAANGNFQG